MFTQCLHHLWWCACKTPDHFAVLICVQFWVWKFAFSRDLKPENILLNEDMHIQITDFGTAKVLSADSRQGMSYLLCHATQNTEQFSWKRPGKIKSSFCSYLCKCSKWSFVKGGILYLSKCNFLNALNSYLRNKPLKYIETNSLTQLKQ